MATSSSTQLMEEINDQFLVCKICFDVFKDPKTLSCLHTFCAECLEKHQDAELERSYRYLLYSRAVSCPICRKKTEVPTGGIKRLPDNFLVANLSDVINRKKPTGDVPLCEICIPKGAASSTAGTKGKSQNGKKNTAVSKCLDCCKLLCQNCVELHRKTKVTQSHGLFDIEVEKDIICKFHPDEVVRFYCEPCEVCVCVLCTFQEHKGHEVSSFTEGIEKYRNSLDSLLMSCRSRITQLKEQTHIITRCEQDMKLTEEQIRDMAIESIAAIRKKEKEMVRDLYLAFGEDTLEFMKEKDGIQESLESLQSTCNLTDIILKDKNIELLLLKKEIQEKLNLLLERKWQSPPPGALQQVHFTPGNPVFGYLQVGQDLQDPKHDELCNDHVLNNVDASVQRFEDKGMSVNTQTDCVSQNDMATTMGKLIQGYCNEQLTQTELIIRKETGTITLPDQGKPLMKTQSALALPELRDRQTMTITTPTMKRKIQTDSVSQTHQETSTPRLSPSKSFNAQSFDTMDRSTMTKIRKLNDQMTTTVGLLTSQDHETLTDVVSTACCGTETTPLTMYNKGTLTNTPNTADKLTSTAKIILNTQQTNTPVIRQADFGVHAKMYGKDASVATRTIVTTHTGTGDQNVTMSDKSVDTPWDTQAKVTAEKETSYDISNKNEGCMTDPPQVGHQNTYTNFFNMVDMSVGTEATTSETTGSSSEVESLDEVCQTMISLIDAILWPNMMPLHKETDTDDLDFLYPPVRAVCADASMNTTTHATTTTGVGDGCCETVDMCSSMTDIHLAVPDTKPRLREQWCSTDQLPTTSTGVATDTLELKDVSLDAYRGQTMNMETNTDKVIIKPYIEMCDTGSNTTSVSVVDVGVVATPLTADTGSVPIPLDVTSTTTNTENPTLTDNHTTMQSIARVQDTFVNTATINISSVGCETMNVLTSESAMTTDNPTMISAHTETVSLHMDDKGTAMDAPTTNECSMMTSIDTTEKGMGTEYAVMRHQETSIDKPFHADAAVGTPAQNLHSKSTSTDPKSVKNFGCYTFVPNVEKATYMPQPVTVTAGTSTPEVHTFNKTTATDHIEISDAGINTVPKRTSIKETTMDSHVLTFDTGTGMLSVDMVDHQTDPIPISVDSCSTNTPPTDVRDAETGMKEIILLSNSTSTNHRVTYDDVCTETSSIHTKDQETLTSEVLKHDKSVFTKPESKSVGILKRPHTVSRGAGTIMVKLCNTATSPRELFSSEQCTMTSDIEMEDKSVDCKPFGLKNKSSSTPVVEVTERSTGTVQAVMSDRASSPVSAVYVERASSPIVFPACERQTSPIPTLTADKSLNVKPATTHMHTSMLEIELVSTGTGTCHIVTCERQCSPVRHLSEKDTLTRGTSMPQIVMQDEEMETELHTANTAVNTYSATLEERGCTPIRQLTSDQGTSVCVPMETKSTYMPKVQMTEKATSHRPVTVHSCTEMPHQTFVEKETCTPQVHTMHKNVATVNMNMVDKNTNTSDVTAVYRDLVAPSRARLVNRGTSMGNAQMVSKETSTPPHAVCTERATSPPKKIMVDKGVLVKKGEILEPVDTYHAAGGKKKPLKPLSSRPTSQLACITEDGESSQDDEPPIKDAKLMPSSIITTKAPRPRLAVSGLNHRERLWPATPRMGKSAVTAFSIEGRPSMASIMCKVEMGTNTPDIPLQSTGTSTLSVGMADKAVSTESLPVETKMAECISKLKTVRQRLEQNQDGMYVQAPGQYSCTTETTSSTTSSTTSTSSVKDTPKLISLNMRSKSFGSQLDKAETRPFESPLAGSKPMSSSDQNSSSDESDGMGNKLKGRLARKQRLDINQLLRSASLPEQQNPPTPALMPKPKIQTIHTHVLPKLNIDDFKPKSKKDTLKKSASRPQTASPDRSPPKVPPRRRTPPRTEVKRGKDAECPPEVPQRTNTPPAPPPRTASLKTITGWTRRLTSSPHRKPKDGSSAKK